MILFAIVLMGIGVPTTAPPSARSAPASSRVAASDNLPDGRLKTPAAAAGFQPSDRIVSFDGKPIVTTGTALLAAIRR